MKPTTPAPVFNAEAGLILYLNEVRARRGLTHQALADLTGIQRPHITALFSGGRSPRLATLMTVCNALGVQIMLQTQAPGLPDFGITPVGWEQENEAVEAWLDGE